ncbi:dTDP-4-dehydrorhamnose 3,5-epimerase [Pusillimonas sp. DMV24BSW_D]|uniref:dTDP-4-dehydrorhamnose 3,5-epimerase n=1 Tax=Neopusillimonas aestuarii TaxID=2716226 RepID=UPI00140DD2CF|nr:dTDP-4-dehydrorhamnose 3,5-epimerase [Pusillimonas sp. DMV24BSW_D]QIM48056.1 dTDP-4-dehydrorhamnose 3,5-epimerase [Pusillimonas sp. DMV24BSW_D]
MRITPTTLPGVLLIEPRVFEDARGWFLESFNARQFEAAVGANVQFVQDNVSHSKRHVLRGLHYQTPQSQGKLVQVISGEIFDIAVDLRRSSSAFGQWVGHILSAENHHQVWIPEGFAHGFLTLSDTANVLYKVTNYYAPECEHTLAWNEPALNIQWPLQGEPVLSEKDKQGLNLQMAPVFD